MFSISCGLRVFKSPSIPSINTSGVRLEPAPIVPVPRILKPLFEFKAPPLEPVVKFIPGTIPCKASFTLLIGRAVRSLDVTVETAPVRFAFF